MDDIPDVFSSPESGEISHSPQPLPLLDYSTLCHTCNDVEWKYTCPRCLCKSCSLHCVKRHKQETGCSGERERTKAVPRSQYSENTFYSDYFFLEEVGDAVDRSDRDDMSRSKLTNKNFNRLRSLKRELWKRGVVFYTAPAGMSARCRNRTYFNHKTGVVYWYLRLLFAGSGGGEFYPSGVSETTKLIDLIMRYLEKCKEDGSVAGYIRVLQSRGTGALQAKLDQPSGMVSLDLQKDLMDNLRTRRVMEYPSITVMLC